MRASFDALVDSGNLTGPGLMLSPAAVKAAGLQLEDVKPLAISTAAKGGRLTLVGQVRNVRLELQDKVLVHPLAWVLKDLGSPRCASQMGPPRPWCRRSRPRKRSSQIIPLLMAALIISLLMAALIIPLLMTQTSPISLDDDPPALEPDI